jgi:hypothetical protein
VLPRGGGSLCGREREILALHQPRLRWSVAHMRTRSFGRGMQRIRLLAERRRLQRIRLLELSRRLLQLQRLLGPRRVLFLRMPQGQSTPHLRVLRRRRVRAHARRLQLLRLLGTRRRLQRIWLLRERRWVQLVRMLESQRRSVQHVRMLRRRPLLVVRMPQGPAPRVRVVRIASAARGESLRQHSRILQLVRLLGVRRRVQCVRVLSQWRRMQLQRLLEWTAGELQYVRVLGCRGVQRVWMSEGDGHLVDESREVSRRVTQSVSH